MSIKKDKTNSGKSASAASDANNPRGRGSSAPGSSDRNRSNSVKIVLKSHDAKMLYNDVVFNIKKKIGELMSDCSVTIIPKPTKKKEFVVPSSPHAYAKTNKMAYTWVQHACSVFIGGSTSAIQKATKSIKIPSSVEVDIKSS